MYLERLMITHGETILTVMFERDEPAQDRPVEAIREALTLARQWLHDAMQPAAQPQRQPPETPEEAEQRFYARYGATTNARTWQQVTRWLGKPMAKPHTVDEWMHAAMIVRDEANARAAQDADAAT